MATPRPPQSIATLAELRKQLPAILEAINGSGEVALRAALNPLLALEELGYRIDPGLRPYIERRVRFEPDDAERLGALETEIHERAGRRFAIDEPPQLAEVLFVELGLDPDEPPAKRTAKSRKDEAPTKRTAKSRDAKAPAKPPRGEVTPAKLKLVRPLEPRLDPDRDPPTDPLATLEDRHPVMRPLLEYRQVAAKRPRLASPEEYARARDTGEGLPVTRVQVSLRTSRRTAKRG